MLYFKNISQKLGLTLVASIFVFGASPLCAQKLGAQKQVSKPKQEVQEKILLPTPDSDLDKALDLERGDQGPDKTKWGMHSLLMQAGAGISNYTQADAKNLLGFGFDFGMLLRKDFSLMVGMSFHPEHLNVFNEYDRATLVSIAGFYRVPQKNLKGLEVGFQIGSVSWWNRSSLAAGPSIIYAHKFDDLALMPFVRGDFWVASSEVGGSVYSVQAGIRFEKDL